MPLDNIFSVKIIQNTYHQTNTVDGKNIETSNTASLLRIYQNMSLCMKKAGTIEQYDKCYVEGSIKLQNELSKKKSLSI